jgi:hypothetical protein
MLCTLMCFLGPQLYRVLVVSVSITEVNKKGKIKRKTSHSGYWISLNFAWRGPKSYFVFFADRVPWVMSKVQLHHWILCLRIPKSNRYLHKSSNLLTEPESRLHDIPFATNAQLCT